MQEYVTSALLIWDDESESSVERIVNNEYGVKIETVKASDLLASPDDFLSENGHLLFAVGTMLLSELLDLARAAACSVGFLPPPSAKKLLKRLELPPEPEKVLEIALRSDASAINLLLVNNKVVFGDLITGSIPLVSAARPSQLRSRLSRTLLGIRQFFKFKLQRVVIETASGKKVVTAMSGLILLNRKPGDALSRLGDIDFSQRDNQVALIVVSPFSILEYIKTALIFLFPVEKKELPDSIGFIKSTSLRIEPSLSQWGAQEYGEKARIPLECSIEEDAVRINAPEAYWEANEKVAADKDTIKIENLPDDKETLKYHDKHIPFFSYASEERFKTLFMDLRKDAKIDSIYVWLMLLSTLLATIGLFADSAAVVIGAMLLAPLMAPIVSFAMGVLRGDEQLFTLSIRKIGLGVVLALGASALVTYILPDTTLTSQINARIHPTLLDLFVAILSGIAAAYSKSFQEIIQSLAGVAIAVALVPPLATAGIGIGRGEWLVFAEAFLLFFTNFVGITLAATLTFFMLGYSSVFKSKRSLIIFAIIMLAISYPLHRSYTEIMQAHRVAQALAKERYLVNGKYIIIRDTTVSSRGDVLRLDLHLVSRTALEREDLNLLKIKLQRRFGEKLDIHAQVEYIL